MVKVKVRAVARISLGQRWERCAYKVKVAWRLWWGDLGLPSGLAMEYSADTLVSSGRICPDVLPLGRRAHFDGGPRPPLTKASIAVRC